MKSNLIGLIAISGALVGCGGGGSTSSGQNSTVDGTNVKSYATSAVTLPASSSAFAWDLDGDGTADDRLGSIVGVLALAGDPQTTVTASVTSGSLLFLMQETSTDATQQSAKDAGVKFSLATTPATPPKYDGTDTFTASGSPAQFYGNITAGTFTSNDPAHSTAAVDLTVQLALVDGAPPLNLPITAGRITFNTSADGTKITGGQVNGAIKKTDVDGTVIPAVASLLTAKIAACKAATPTACATYTMFDTNMDGTVTATEIEANPTLSSFLAPDVQLFDAAGNYKPTPNGSTKDSLSVGLGFSGVDATFTL